jgi:predicted DNA-binding transcriptional regulator AlpA
MPDQMLTPNELAERLVRSEKSLEAWRASGTGPAYVRVGRQIRYRERDVEAWLQANTVPTRSAPAAPGPPAPVDAA